MASLNALVLVGAIIVSLLLIIVLIIKSRCQAQPQPETDLEQGVLPAAAPLVTSNSHNVWTKQEVSPVPSSQVSMSTKSHSSSPSRIAMKRSTGNLQYGTFEETSLPSEEGSTAGVFAQVPDQEKLSGNVTLPQELRDHDHLRDLEHPGVASKSEASPDRRLADPQEASAEMMFTRDKYKKSGSAQKIVKINSRRFKCIKELGKGSFGTVWEVVTSDDDTASEAPTLAVKISSPEYQELVDACMFEGEVLSRLASELPVGARSGVPRYVDHCARRVGDKVEVRLAMSKLDGVPLDEWLYGIGAHEWQVISVPDLLDGALPKGQRSTRGLDSTSHIVAVLWTQMAPILSTLHQIAFHRDISAHNFLIAEDASKFHMVDFGMAVEVESWKKVGWKDRGIGGDPRYFPPSAWMMVTHGHRYLEDNPIWQRQYAERLDHHAFGMLMCEVFFVLWKPEEEFEAHSLLAARAAWRNYWTTSVALFQLYSRAGEEGVREYLAGPGKLEQFGEQLRLLVRCLAAVTGGEASTMLKVAGDLLDPAGGALGKDRNL